MANLAVILSKTQALAREIGATISDGRVKVYFRILCREHGLKVV
jgi:hypothetical protein